MPEPRKGEKKQDYISRCISYMISKEGRKKGQAAAICYSMWREHEKKGGGK